MVKPDRKDLFAVGILVALCLLFFWRFFTPNQADQVMFPKGDFSYQFYAWRAMIYQELRAGHVPLWTPNIYSGYPLQADPQSAIFYPPALLANLAALVAGLRQFPFRLLEFEVIGHILLGSIFTYVFLRTQVKRRSSALLGSLAFAYGGYLTSYPMLQMAILESAIWLPLALFGLWGRYERKQWNYLWITAFALGMSILAGHPQTSMMVLYAILAFQVFQLFRAKEHWYVGVRDVGFVLIMAAGLSAIQSIPSWQYARLSTRADLPLDQAGSGFPVGDLAQMVVTGLVSMWHPLYIGILPLLLVAIALTVKPKGAAWFWLGVAIVALLLSFGSALFGFQLAYLFLPSYRLFRSQERLAFLVSFSLSVLAAYGADALWRAATHRGRATLRGILGFGRLALIGAFVALLLATWFHRQGLDPSDSGDLPTHLGILFLALAGSVGILVGRLQAPRRRFLWQGLSLGLVVINLFSLNQGINQVPVDMVYPVTEPIRILSQDEGLFRFQDDYRLPAQSACVQGLNEVWGIAPIRLARYEEFMSRAPEALRWELLNVKYVVSWRGSLVSAEGVAVPSEVVYQEGQGKDVLYVHRIQSPGPRAWVVRGTYLARTDDELYAYMSSPYFDPMHAAVLDKAVTFPAAPAGIADKVEILDYAASRISLRVDMASQGLLVLSEVAYPGWQAYVNGGKVPIERAYGILRSVVLEGGTSLVEFRYEPLVLYVGAALSLCTWLLLLAALVRYLITAQSQRARPSR